MSYSDVTMEELDKGRRASDIINGIITSNEWDDIKHGFLAIRLSDGGSDGVVYDTKVAAIRHQIYEQQCAYVALRNMVAGANPKDCAIFIKYNADAYQAGLRLVDPDNMVKTPELVLPTGGYDSLRNNFRAAVSRGFAKGTLR